MTTAFIVTFIYAIVAFLYLMYRYYPILFMERKKYVSLKFFVTVVVPVYNEPASNLRNCLQSIVDTEANKEIIIVDDCSTLEETEKVIEEFVSTYPDMVRFFRQDKNMGKRQAQSRAMVEARGDLIITVDSDTLLAKDSIIELTKPFSDPLVGATTGEILVENHYSNFLTAILQARYWSAFNFEREGLSRFGVVTCCSGPLAAYRKSLMLDFNEDYVNERFLGNICTFGDDRHMTRMILESGNQVVYTPYAKARTYVPEGFWDFLRQQIRWKKSFIRESTLILPYAFQKGGVLLIETLTGLIMPIAGIYVRIVLILLFFRFPFVLPFYFLMMIFTATMRSLLMIERKEWQLWLRNVVYAYLHETIIFWLFPVAFFTLHQNQWGNRGLKTQVKS